MTSFIRTCALLALAAVFAVGGLAGAEETEQPAAQDRGEAQLGPDELIEDVAQRMLKELDAHREEYKKNPKLVNKLVDEILLPHFDTEYAAQRVLGKHWRTATPEQRQRFIKAFYQSLVENYGSALVEFTSDKLRILPFRGDPDAANAVVRTEVRTSDGTRVPVNYSMRKTPEGWKAWDVTIEGISYVKSFRTDFGAEIEQKGLEAVIQRLEKEGPQVLAEKAAGRDK